MSKERLEELLNNPAIQHKEILWAIEYAKEQAEQNKRYREALLQIANEDTYTAYPKDIAIHALESESE